MDVKTPVGMRITRDGTKLLNLLAEKYGIPKTAVVELALRDLAEKAGIELPKDKEVNP